MAKTLKDKVRIKVEGSTLSVEPFTFLYIQDFFPIDYYNNLESVFPDDSQLVSINDKEYKPVQYKVVGRRTLAIHSPEVGYSEIENNKFKNSLIQFRQFVRDFLVPLIASKMQVDLPEQWCDDIRFVVDQCGYSKLPHTDHPNKILSILFYMSRSDRGTTILKPKKQGFSDDFGYDHPLDEFDQIFDPPFIPNSLIAFKRTDTSFHCVNELASGEYRKAIHITVRK
ncbi:hypothetical protein OAU13_00725 [bacterium]|nr:hypothetical protein [bacterium]